MKFPSLLPADRFEPEREEVRDGTYLRPARIPHRILLPILVRNIHPRNHVGRVRSVAPPRGLHFLLRVRLDRVGLGRYHRPIDAVLGDDLELSVLARVVLEFDSRAISARATGHNDKSEKRKCRNDARLH